MKRNIVKQGPSTLMISLPSSWVKKYNLEKGEQLDVEEEGRKLIVSTEKRKESGTKVIKLLHNWYYYVWQELAASYLGGYDVIKVYYKYPENLEFIQQSVLISYVGFEIIEQTKDHVILKKVVQENIEEYETIVRRVFLGLIEVSKAFLEVLYGKAEPSLILSFERVNNRQTYYLKRLLTKEGYKEKNKTNFAYVLQFLLENLMNQYKYASWTVEKDKRKKFDKEIISLFEQIHEKIELLYKLYFSYSSEAFQHIETDTVKPDSRTGRVLDTLEKDPKMGHYIMAMIEYIRYASYQIHGINS